MFQCRAELFTLTLIPALSDSHSRSPTLPCTVPPRCSCERDGHGGHIKMPLQCFGENEYTVHYNEMRPPRLTHRWRSREQLECPGTCTLLMSCSFPDSLGIRTGDLRLVMGERSNRYAADFILVQWLLSDSVSRITAALLSNVREHITSHLCCHSWLSFSHFPQTSQKSMMSHGHGSSNTHDLRVTWKGQPRVWEFDFIIKSDLFINIKSCFHWSP